MSASLLHRIATLRRRLWRSLAVATVALGLAGCGSSSSNSTTTSAGASGGFVPNVVSDEFKFANCMREHGVANFPDPTVSTSSIRLKAPVGLKSSPAVQTAMRACRGILPTPNGAGQQVSDGPSKQALLELARCIRSNGYPRFPDPDAHGRLTGDMVAAAGIDMQAPGFLHTAETCAGATKGQITAATVAQTLNHATATQSASSGNGQ